MTQVVWQSKRPRVLLWCKESGVRSPPPLQRPGVVTVHPSSLYSEGKVRTVHTHKEKVRVWEIRRSDLHFPTYYHLVESRESMVNLLSICSSGTIGVVVNLNKSTSPNKQYSSIGSLIVDKMRIVSLVNDRKKWIIFSVCTMVTFYARIFYNDENTRD